MYSGVHPKDLPIRTKVTREEDFHRNQRLVQRFMEILEVDQGVRHMVRAISVMRGTTIGMNAQN